MLTPYAFAENDVIRCIDLDGMEKVIYTITYDQKAKTWGVSKLELEKAGTLGDGVLVKLDNYFFYAAKTADDLAGFSSFYEHPQYKAYKVPGETQYTIGAGHALLTPDEIQTYVTEGYLATDEQIAAWLTTDLKQRAVKIKGGNKFLNEALTSWCMGGPDGKLGYKIYNKFKKDNPKEPNENVILRNSRSSYVGVKKKRVGEFLIIKDNKYYLFDYGKPLQKIWKAAYDKIISDQSKKQKK